MTCKNCKRQATWSVTFYDGMPAPTKSGATVYCKAHCDDEIARLREEMPDAERKRRHDLEKRRHDVIYRFAKISYELDGLRHDIDLLEAGSPQGNGFGWKYTTPDPAFAAQVRGVMAALGDVGLLRQCITSLEALAKQDFPPAPMTEEEKDAWTEKMARPSGEKS